MHECTFFIRHIIAFLHLGTLGSTSVLWLGAILCSEIANKKQKNVKKGHEITLEKGTCLQYKSRNRKMECCFVWPGNGCVRWLFFLFLAILYTSLNDDYETWFGGCTYILASRWINKGLWIMRAGCIHC